MIACLFTNRLFFVALIAAWVVVTTSVEPALAQEDDDPDVSVQAVEKLENALKQDPNSWRLHYKLGRAMLDLGRFRKAEENYLSCIMLDPKKDSARFGMAMAYEHSGRFADATLVYKQILKQQPLTERSRRMAEHALRRLNYYRSLGDAHAPDYVFAKEFDDSHSWKKTSFPLKVAIWSDPEMKEVKQPFYDYVVRAFERWRIASGGKTTYKIVNDQRSADIVCKLVRVMRGSKHMGIGDKLGETNLQWDDKDDDKFGWSRIEIFWDEHYTLTKLEACVLHEVGHALGLNHSSNNHDIMFPIANPPYPAILSDRDKNSLRVLYAK